MSGLTEPFSPPTAVTITIDTMAGALIDPVHHNSVIAIVSVRTARNSVLGYMSTNDEVAKFFYILSFGLATSAASFS